MFSKMNRRLVFTSWRKMRTISKALQLYPCTSTRLTLSTCEASIPADCRIDLLMGDTLDMSKTVPFSGGGIWPAKKLL